MPKLNQIIAIEKGVKSRAYAAITEMHKANQKPDLFNGFSKQYRKKDEEGEQYPPEEKLVQVTVGKTLESLREHLTQIFDVTATKDWANCEARADITIEGEMIAEQVPATYLLFLEKQLTDLRTFIDALPTLDTADHWQEDVNSGLFRTNSLPTQRTKKEQRPIVLYEATKEHPAQTQLITEDIVVGYWDTVKQSGALPVPRREILLKRVDALQRAVKMAREEANGVEATEQKIGQQIFRYLLA